MVKYRKNYDRSKYRRIHVNLIRYGSGWALMDTETYEIRGRAPWGKKTPLINQARAMHLIVHENNRLHRWGELPSWGQTEKFRKKFHRNVQGISTRIKKKIPRLR